MIAADSVRPGAVPIAELDPRLEEVARAAAVVDAGDAAQIGAFQGADAEDDVAVTVRFAATDPGYQGWRWSVTLAVLESAEPTVSEVVLLPGPDALLAPEWVPWDQRIRPGDLGVGDLLPPVEGDPRIVPAYVLSDDPAVEELAFEVGFGRVRVLSRDGRADAAERWHEGAFGPGDDIARAAPGQCLSCAFYLPLAGSLGVTMGACANEYSPADGRVVDSRYGCGAHSETVVEPLRAPIGESVIDELRLEVHQREVPAEPTAGQVDVADEPVGDQPDVAVLADADADAGAETVVDDAPADGAELAAEPVGDLSDLAVLADTGPVVVESFGDESFGDEPVAAEPVPADPPAEDADPTES